MYWDDSTNYSMLFGKKKMRNTINHPTFSLTTLAFLLVLNFGNGQSLKLLNNPETVQQKMDSIIQVYQSEYKVTGTTYAIVRKDQILAENGMGLANIQSGQAMDAEKTTFMLGSLSKLIVATAVMQLVEKGQLELDEDVNIYLNSVKVPPLTLRQLLTHTAGFEEKTFGRLRLEEKNFLSLEEYLKKRMPAQIFPAGSLGAYSNHGMALAGLIVQEVSGQLFEDYVEKNIFLPLGMNNASFRLNEESKPNLATPYLIQKGEPVKTHYQYVQTIPASMFIGSAHDMAHFMMAHLNGGILNKNRMLNRETLSTLHQRQYSGHPEINGRALGFFEKTYRGKRGLTHGNNRNGFHSYIHLIPEDSIGIFVTINGGIGSFRTKVINEFLNALYPPVQAKTPDFIELGNFQKFAGTYLNTRRNETSIERIFHQVVLDRSIKVTALGDTALFLPNEVFKMEKPSLFSNPTGTFKVAFSDENGVHTLHLPGRSDAFQKIPWYGQKEFTAFALGISLLTFITIALIRLINIFKRKKKKSNPIGNYWWAFSATGLLFIISFLGSMAIIAENIQYGIPFYFYLIFLLPILSILFFILALLQTFSQWKNLRIMTRWSHGYLILIGLLFLWQMYYWNFIGFEF